MIVRFEILQPMAAPCFLVIVYYLLLLAFCIGSIHNSVRIIVNNHLILNTSIYYLVLFSFYYLQFLVLYYLLKQAAV